MLIYLDINDPDFNTVFLFSSETVMKQWQAETLKLKKEIKLINDLSADNILPNIKEMACRVRWVNKALNLRDYGGDLFIPLDIRWSINDHERNMPLCFDKTTNFAPFPIWNPKSDAYHMPDGTEVSNRDAVAYRAPKNHRFSNVESATFVEI